MLVDTNEQALVIQNVVYGLSKPNFEVETRQKDLFDIPFESLDLVAANHFIDDLVAVEYARIWGLDYALVFSNPDLQQEFWARVSIDLQPGRDIMRKIYSKI